MAIIALQLATPAWAQDNAAATADALAAKLAKDSLNPVAAMISVPFQYNYDEYGGVNDGASVSVLNIRRLDLGGWAGLPAADGDPGRARH